MKPMNPMVMMTVIIESRAKMMELEERAMMSVTMPKAGIISMYTSECLKNQNRYWNSMTSPPNMGRKKHEL